MKKTLVFGASPNINRFSNRAVELLKEYGHEVVAFGNKKALINNVQIDNTRLEYIDIDTITMYLSSANQTQYYDYILSLNPKRIIFNPGSENNELIKMAKSKNIEVVEDCTLVMLNCGSY